MFGTSQAGTHSDVTFTLTVTVYKPFISIIIIMKFQDFDEVSVESGSGLDSEVTPSIEGNSSMADISRSFLQLANPLKDVAFSIDASICRPKASEPDTQKATIIIGVLIFTLMSVVVEVRKCLITYHYLFHNDRS